MTTKTSVRDNIVTAALELAQSVGLQSVSQARVATHAGVRQSHLTYYFPTRVDLIKATLEKVIDQKVQENNRIVEEGDNEQVPRIARLRKFFTAKVRNRASTRLIVSFMLVSQEDPELSQWFARFDKETMTRFSNQFRHNGLVVSDFQLQLFHATLIGVAVRSLHLCSDEALTQASELIGVAFDNLVEASRQTNVNKPA